MGAGGSRVNPKKKKKLRWGIPSVLQILAKEQVLLGKGVILRKKAGWLPEIMQNAGLSEGGCIPTARPYLVKKGYRRHTPSVVATH